MSDIAERIDAIVKADLAARLKAAGFRRSGRTFYRQVGEHLQRAIKATSSPHWKRRFQAWAERTGVALEPS